MEKNLYKAAEVAERLGISRAFAYKLMRQGQITSVRIGRSIRVRPEDLSLFIKENVIRQGGEINHD